MKSLYSFFSSVNSASIEKLSESLATNSSIKLLNKFILRTAGVVALFVFLGGSVWGQNGIIGSGFTNGWGTGDIISFDQGAGATRIKTLNPRGTGNQFFRLVRNWSGDFNQFGPAGCVDVDWSNPGLIYGAATCNQSGAFYINCPNTTDNYVFKTPNGNSSTSLLYFRIQGSIRTISSVATNPVIPDYTQAATITATLSGSLSAGQGVYLRYSTNDFSASTIVEMTGSSSTYSAVIPAQAVGTNVKYYLFTSGSSLTISHGDADLYTINLNNNGGSNYSYTTTAATRHAIASGDWNSSSVWSATSGGVGGASVPASGDNAIIGSGYTISTTSNTSVRSITFTGSGTGVLSIGSNSILSVSETVVSNSGATGSIVGSGALSFAGGNSITGAVGFNNVNISGGVNFGLSSTINGTLTINAGGFVSTNAPTYGASSLLLYNTTGTYERGLEWSATSGAGYPNNVQLSNNTTLNLGNGGTNIARQCAGSLTVDVGSTLSLNINAMSQALIVKGNYTNNGTTILSGTSGGDLKLEGDLDDNGTFTANGRAIFFEGGNNQTINSSSNPLDIDVMRIGKTGGEVILSQNLLVDETNDPIQFTTTTSILNLNGYTATFGKANAASFITMNASSKIKGSSTSSLEILGTGAFGTIYFDQTTPGTTNALNNFTINRTSSGSATLANSIAVSGTLTITEGTLNLGTNRHTANALTLGSTVQATGTSYGGTGSPAENIISSNFAATSGYINVGTCSEYSLSSTSAVACLGSGATVTLSNSVTSQLPVGNYTVFYTLTGANTGSSTSAMNVTTAGIGSFTTTAIANSGATTITINFIRNGCVSTIGANNTAVITVNSLPTALTLTGSTYCSTALGGTVTSSSSASGVNYSLYNNGVIIDGTELSGTGSALNWSNVSQGSTYSVIGINATTFCTSPASNTVSVSSQAATYSYYLDSDNDGYGTGTAVGGCDASAPAGYSMNTGDCNNNSSAVYPTATELCGNNIDENCSGSSDDLPSFYRTIADGNWGDAGTWEAACAAGVTYTTAAYAPPSYYTGMVNILNSHDVTIPANGTTYQTGTLDIDNGGSLTLTGNDFIISPTTATVSPIAKLTVTVLIDNAGTLNIGHQASLVQTSTTASNTGSGNINVESKLTGTNNGTAPNGRYWYIGSPMNNTLASQFFNTSEMVRLWNYNASNNSWGVVIHSTSSPTITTDRKLIPGIGYLYRAGANKTITYIGTAAANLNNNITSNLLAPTVDENLVPVTGYNGIGYKFVANPYPSHIDWRLVTRTGLNVSYWIRNAANTAYEAYNATTNVSTSPSGQTTRYIAPMQGFWVYAFTASPSLRIDNTDRVHADNVLHSPVINQVVRLKLNDGKSSDYAVVYENELAANDFEETDTDKMFDYDFHQLYTLEGEHELSLNGLLNATAKGSVDMGMVVPNNGPYTLEATDLGVEEDVILEDKFNHTFQDLKVNPVYSFTSNAGTFNNRFVLHFTAIETETVTVGESVGEREGVMVYTTTGQQVKVWVTNTAEFQNATVKVYDAIGNLIERKNMTSNELLLDLDIANGIYVVEVTGVEKVFTKKIYITK